MVPEYRVICENMLMAEGFVDASLLARKFTQLYALCRDLLSASLHYDWGLRAINSVLVKAGEFKRAEPSLSEDAILLRALRDFNTPKIIQADFDIFMRLLGDLFPGIEVSRKRDMELEATIVETVEKHKLTPEPEFIKKIVQFKELIDVRWSVFIMGPPATGKTSVWQMLAKSQNAMNIKTKTYDINPKVVSTANLYGYPLPSGDWKEGILSKTMKDLSDNPDLSPKWIVLDGDLDTNWIESMNSVMDNNKLLTLANGDRIKLKDHMWMLFEIRDLIYASAATVSRAGILYYSDDKGDQWRSFIKTWLKKQSINWAKIIEAAKSQKKGKADKTIIEYLEQLFDEYVFKVLEFMRKSCKFVVPTVPLASVSALCKGLESLLNGTEEIRNLKCKFNFAAIWAFGGQLMMKDGIEYRKNFSDFWVTEFKKYVKFPRVGTVFDINMVEDGDNITFGEWDVATIEFNSTTQQMSSITVPTPETTALQSVMKNYISRKYPILLIGSAGCGKT